MKTTSQVELGGMYANVIDSRNYPTNAGYEELTFSEEICDLRVIQAPPPVPEAVQEVVAEVGPNPNQKAKPSLDFRANIAQWILTVPKIDLAILICLFLVAGALVVSYFRQSFGTFFGTFE